MHYYPHHIGDYQRDTAHLSVTEHGVYRLLLDHYYATERPLPTSQKEICRILGVATKREKGAVSTVLAGFFELTRSGWFHARCETELALLKAKGWHPSEEPSLRPSPDVWKVTRIRIFQRDGFRCFYCGATGNSLECDHKQPVSRGGTNDDENLVTACKACNRRKSNRTVAEFLNLS